MANDLDRTTPRFASVFPDLCIRRELGGLHWHTSTMGGDHTLGDPGNSVLSLALRHVEASETDRSCACGVRNKSTRKGLNHMESAVNHQATIATYEALLDFGFQPEDMSLLRFSPGLRFDFGGFVLSAASLLSLTGGEVIQFSGVLATANTLAEIDFEMPRLVISHEQCAAWIVWHLDQSSPGRRFQSRRCVSWVEEGRQNQKLLPWVMDMAAYHSRPLCTVRRDWWRLALKTLDEHLSLLPDSATVIFSFDGFMLSIRVDGNVVALPGEGLPWVVRFKMNAGQLRHLPKRLMRECIYLSIWESRLTIDRRTYEGNIDVSALAGRAEIQ